MTLEDVIADLRDIGDTDGFGWLEKLLTEEGHDILTAEDGSMVRGTPVYARADADAIEVQRRMAQFHIRNLPVVKDGHVIAILDLVELAQHDLTPKAI